MWEDLEKHFVARDTGTVFSEIWRNYIMKRRSKRSTVID